MDEHLKIRIGIAVREARKRSGLTQEALAERLDRTSEAVSNIERGRALPTLETLIRLTEALKVPLAELLPEAGAESSGSPKRLAAELKAMGLLRSLGNKELEIALRQIEVLVEFIKNSQK